MSFMLKAPEMRNILLCLMKVFCWWLPQHLTAWYSLWEFVKEMRNNDIQEMRTKFSRKIMSIIQMEFTFYPVTFKMYVSGISSVKESNLGFHHNLNERIRWFDRKILFGKLKSVNFYSEEQTVLRVKSLLLCLQCETFQMTTET